MKEHECYNEDRLTKLEVYAKERNHHIENLETKLSRLDDTIQDLCVSLAQINSALSTLKWIIGIFVVLFSSVICFMVKGIIHLL